jgi:hypothetical protein
MKMVPREGQRLILEAIAKDAKLPLQYVPIVAAGSDALAAGLLERRYGVEMSRVNHG